MRCDFQLSSLVSALFLVGVFAGCGKPPEAVFVTGEPTRSLITEARKAVEKTVKEDFGTPQELIGWERFPVDYGRLPGSIPGAVAESHGDVVVKGPAHTGGHAEAAPAKSRDVGYAIHVDPALPGWKLIEGRNLYMRHCLHCHGVSGDGNGPTAKYLNPLPRDYRQGIFKFKSTLATVKVSRNDLKRTLKDGIPGTSMPSFVLLNEASLDSLIEYIRWLSMRGEFEKKLTSELAGDYSDASYKQRLEAKEKKADILKGLEVLLKGENGAAPEFQTTIEDVANALAEDWKAADDEANVIVPKIKRIDPVADAQSIARGRNLYMSPRTKCFTCHGVGGKGDGTSTVDYWPIPGTTPERKYPERGLHDEWGHPQQPRNLTQGIYRGGRRPVDLYRRVYAGIKGTQMPAFGGTVLNDKEIWDLVNYVLAIPYQTETPPAVLQAGTGN